MAKTPKNIQIHQIADIPVEDIRPGHIIAEGIVLTRPRPHQGGFFIDTASSNGAVFARAGETVQVYAAISAEMAEQAREAAQEGRS